MRRTGQGPTGSALAQEANSLALRIKIRPGRAVCCSLLGQGVLRFGPSLWFSLTGPRRVWSFLRRGFFASTVRLRVRGTAPRYHGFSATSARSGA